MEPTNETETASMIERIREALSERRLINLIARLIPWGASFIPASFAYQNSLNVLHLSSVQAFFIGAVAEGLGVATIHTTFTLWEFRTNHPDKDATAVRRDALIMSGMASLYVALIIFVNVVLDLNLGANETTYHAIAKAGLSLISLPAAVTLSIRSLHALRVGEDETGAEIRSLRARLAAQTRSAQTAQAKLNDAQQTAKGAQQTAKEAQRDAAAAQRVADDAQRELEKTQSHVDALREQIAEVKQQRDDAQADADKYRRYLMALDVRYRMVAMLAAGDVDKDSVMQATGLSIRTIETDLAKMRAPEPSPNGRVSRIG